MMSGRRSGFADEGDDESRGIRREQGQVARNSNVTGTRTGSNCSVAEDSTSSNLRPTFVTNTMNSPGSFGDESRPGDEYDADYFGGDECLVEEDEQPLTWRMDPDESLSDWTIAVITTMPSDDITTSSASFLEHTFHVHKNMLAVGPCKSDYFVSLFRNPRVRESQTNTSRIELQPEAVEAMPFLLDFVYSAGQHLPIDAKLAVSLRFCAQYFGMRLLHKKILQFVREDMKVENVHLYLEQSMVFHDDRILGMATELCTDRIQEIEPSSPLLEALSPELFLQIISSPDIDTCGTSCHLSKIVAAYCTAHANELDQDMFEQISDRRVIPLVDKAAAFALLKIDRRSAGESDEGLSCLQKRCTTVVSENWKDFADYALMNHNEGGGSISHSDGYEELSKPVLAELHQRSLRAAKREMDGAVRKMEQMDRGFEEMEAHLNQVVREMSTSLKSTERLKSQLAKEVHQLKEELVSKERELKLYKEEMKRFHRVPNQHAFRDVKKCTYHVNSKSSGSNNNISADDGSSPADNPGPIASAAQFGRLPPTAMPTMHIGTGSEDGYLFLQKRKSGVMDRWPVYYYKDE